MLNLPDGWVLVLESKNSREDTDLLHGEYLVLYNGSNSITKKKGKKIFHTSHALYFTLFLSIESQKAVQHKY